MKEFVYKFLGVSLMIPEGVGFRELKCGNLLETDKTVEDMGLDSHNFERIIPEKLPKEIEEFINSINLEIKRLEKSMKNEEERYLSYRQGMKSLIDGHKSEIKKLESEKAKLEKEMVKNVTN